LLNGQRLGIAQAKGRFFTPEQIFGNDRGAAVRAYAEESIGLDAFPSNAYQQPTKTLEELRKVGYTDGKPPEAPAAAPAAGAPGVSGAPGAAATDWAPTKEMQMPGGRIIGAINGKWIYKDTLEEVK